MILARGRRSPPAGDTFTGTATRRFLREPPRTFKPGSSLRPRPAPGGGWTSTTDPRAPRRPPRTSRTSHGAAQRGSDAAARRERRAAPPSPPRMWWAGARSSGRRRRPPRSRDPVEEDLDDDVPLAAKPADGREQRAGEPVPGVELGERRRDGVLTEEPCGPGPRDAHVTPLLVGGRELHRLGVREPLELARVVRGADQDPVAVEDEQDRRPHRLTGPTQRHEVDEAGGLQAGAGPGACQRCGERGGHFGGPSFIGH